MHILPVTWKVDDTEFQYETEYILVSLNWFNIYFSPFHSPLMIGGRKVFPRWSSGESGYVGLQSVVYIQTYRGIDDSPRHPRMGKRALGDRHCNTSSCPRWMQKMHWKLLVEEMCVVVCLKLPGCHNQYSIYFLPLLVSGPVTFIKNP